MNCSKCGMELPENTVFCTECGTKVAKTKQLRCKNCGTKLTKDDLFCPDCGEPIEKILECQTCGTLFSSDVQYCTKCGGHEIVETNKKKEIMKMVQILCKVMFLKITH